MTANL